MEQHSKSAHQAVPQVTQHVTQQTQDARDALIDQALMDTFPASDPISLMAFD